MFGAFFFAPPSEIYGRAPMMRLGCGFFVVFNFGCGFARTHCQLAFMRLFCGIFAGAPMGLSQVILAEIWGKQRGRPLCLCSLAATVGPCIGTILGCLTIEVLSWKKFFWLTSAVGCTSLFVMSMFIPETYPPEDLKDVISVQPEEGRLEKGNILKTLQEQPPSISPSQRPSLLNPCALQDALRALTRPIRIAWKEPIAIVIGLQLALIYTIFAITQCSLIHIFRYDLGQSMQISGLHCLLIIFGACLASKMDTCFLSTLCDRLHIKNPHPDHRLEYKLRCMIPGTFVLAIGSVIFALARFYHTSSAVFDLALFFIGAAMTLASRKATTYIIDKHKEQAASALVVSTSFRRLASFVTPIAVHLTNPMQRSTKLEKFMPVLLLVFILPTPWILFKYKPKTCRITHQ
ncbi:major facilitator superfamily domain-containing protein [Melampsora americana]|nr:major facilitator superfamily domain-containing protein [Melampsora americana]